MRKREKKPGKFVRELRITINAITDINDITDDIATANKQPLNAIKVTEYIWNFI